MKKYAKILHFTIVLIIFLTLFMPFNLMANIYSWTGAVDNIWSKNGNWSCSSGTGYPNSTNDTVSISSSTAINCMLDSNRTIGRLVISSDSLNLNGKTLVTASSSSLSAGCIYNGTADCRGSSIVFSGTTVDVVVAISGVFQFSNTTFYQTVTADNNGTTACNSTGNNVFKSDLILSNSGGGSVSMSKYYRDIYEKAVSLFDTLGGTISLATTDTSLFFADITIASKGSGINFGNVSGYASLASGKKFLIGSKGFSSGTLLFYNFIQNGMTSQELTLTSSGILNLNASKFGGDITFTAPSLLSKNSTFSGKSYFTKTGTASNSWEGGNTFMGRYCFTNTASPSGQVTMQANASDYYGDSVTINSAGSRYFASTSGESVYSSSLYFTGNMVDFSQGSGSIKFAGSGNQVIKGSDPLSITNLVINKTSGTLTLQTPVKITSTLTFNKGIIITDTTNLLTILAGASCSGASNASFVSGPVKKIGNASPFTFPTGKGSVYNPIAITGSLNTTDAFLAEYFNTSQTAGDSLSDSIKYVYDCNYWKLKQTTGSTNVYVTLGWNTACVIDTGLLRIAKWDGAKWANLGRGTFTGSTSGTIKSATSGTQNYYLALANPNLVSVASLSSLPGRSLDHFYGISGANTFRNTGHDWRFDNPVTPGTPNQDLINNVQGLYPGLLKYNAGANGNFLDWKKGWYFNDDHMYKYNQLLPENMFNNDLFDDQYVDFDVTLLRFKNALDFTGAVPVFQLNITSSDIEYQLALLLEARKLNIPVKYIELGGEINIDKVDGSNLRAFATGLEYGKTVYEWTRRIKDLLGEEVKVGACAANNAGDTRRDEWNELMIGKLKALELANPTKLGPDALIIHQYIHDIGGTPPASPGAEITGVAGFNKMFTMPYKNINTGTSCLFNNEIAEIENLYLNRDYEIWLTEYGINEDNWLVYGTWASGLFTAMQSLLFLEKSSITMAVDFTLWSNCIFGDIFINENAFLNEGDPDEVRHQFPFSSLTDPNYQESKTDQYSALGHAMKHIGKATANSKYARQLSFTNNPNIGNNINHFDGLYGWFFSDQTPFSTTSKDQAVIINVSNQAVSVDISGIGSGSWTNYDITRVDMTDPDGSPGNFVLGYDKNSNIIPCMKGDGTITDVPPLIDDNEDGFGPSISIPPYSIIRLYNCATPALTVTATANPICSGQAVTLNLVTPLEIGWTIDNWSIDGNPVANSSFSYFTDTPAEVEDACDPVTIPYTVSVSNTGCGFTTTASLSLNVYHSVNVAIYTADDLPACPGTEIKLEAASEMVNCGQSVNYEWITAHGDGIGNSTSITISPEDTITYILYANWKYTNPNFQCAAVASKKIRPDPPYLHLPTDTTVCYGDLMEIILPQYDDDAVNEISLSDYTFAWSIDNYPIIPNVPNHFIQPTTLAYGQHTLTVAVFNHTTSSCTLTVHMTVNVSECCGDHALAINASYNHDGQALADMLSDPGSNYIGTYTYNTATKTLTMQIGASNSQQIPVNGKWTPDYSVNLRKVELQMSEGAQIEIHPHRTLAIQGAKIRGCTGKLWRGVNLLPGAAINVTDWSFTSNGTPYNFLSEVGDAEFFITANHLSRVTLNLSTFDKNYISFYVPPATQFPANVIYGSNNLNHFTCDANTGTSKLPTPYLGQITATGAHPFAGMVFNDVAVNVDDAALNEDPSSFENLNNGILAMNSSVGVFNCTFKTLKKFDTYAMPLNAIGGTGIFSGADIGKYGSLTQEGFAPTLYVQYPFYDCNVGIHTNHVAADITLNYMSEIGIYGIRSENAYRTPIRIESNHIKSYNTGIYSFNNWSSAGLNINNNEIGSPYLAQIVPGNIAILIDEIPTFALSRPSEYNIMCNTIIDDFVTGIQMTALPYTAQIVNNDIDMSSSYLNWGMRFLACNGVTVWSNTVHGNDVAKGTAYEFSLNSNNTWISDNKSTGTEIGFDFLGPNTNTRFVTNEIGDPNATGAVHDVGVKLENPSDIGYQYVTNINGTTTVYNNLWVADPTPNGNVYSSNHGAENDNNLQLSYQYSQFKVPNTSNPGDADYPNFTCAGGGAWFLPKSNYIALSSGYNNDCIKFHRSDNKDEATESDRLLAKDSIFFDVMENQMRYTLESDLQDKLTRNDSLRENDSLFTSFYNNKQYTPLGLLSRVRFLIQEIFNDNIILTEEMGKIDSLIKTLHLRKSVIDSAQQSEISETDSIALEIESTNIMQQISNNILRQNVLLTQLNEERQSKIDTSFILNISISTNVIIEQNEQVINGIYLDKIVYGNINLDSTQLANVDYIAPQCPIEGGRAIFIARAIKIMLGDSTIYDDNTACAGSESRLAHKSNSTNSYFIKVSPNPVNENCTFYFQLPLDIPGKIQIYNVPGELIAEINLDENSSKINFSAIGFKPGFYLFKLISDGRIIGNGKLAIVK